MVLSAGLGAFVIAVFAILGALVVRLILGTKDGLAILGLSVPIGGGLMSWSLFLVSWAGVQLTALTSIFVWVLLVGACVGLIRLGWPNVETHFRVWAADQSPWDQWVRRVGWIAFTLLIGLAMFLSVAHAYGSWDAAAGWAAKGYGIAKEGSVFAGKIWGAWALTYPLNLPIQIAQFQLFGHDLIPLSKLLFPIYLASLGMGIYHFWRSQRVSNTLASLGMIFVITVPHIYLHGTRGYANLPLAAYLVQATLWGMVGLGRGDRRAMLMSGLLLGLAGWTRAEAFTYCVAVVVALGMSFWFAGRRRFNLMWWLLPFVIITGAWLVFGWHAVSADRLGGTAFKNLLAAWPAGELHLRQLYLIPRLLYDRALEITRWGALFQVTAILVILRLYTLRPGSNPYVFSAFSATALVSLVAVGLFYLQSYALGSTFQQVLTESFDRAFFPAAVLMLVTAVRMYATAMPNGTAEKLEASEFPQIASQGPTF